MALRPVRRLGAVLAAVKIGATQELAADMHSTQESRRKVSIVALAHNAPRYCRIFLRSLALTQGVDYELIFVDNDSSMPTKALLGLSYLRGQTHRLCFLNRNTLFAEGNNIGAALSSRDSTHILLINSDVEIRDAGWLRRLLDVHKRGATAYGYVANGPWPRADGYCFLIDRDLYLKHQLDEGHQWWWGITKLQAWLLRNGLSVQAIRDHEKQIHHFGGKSGEGFKTALGMNVEEAEVREWFGGRSVQVLDSV